MSGPAIRLRRGGLALCDASALITPKLLAMIGRHVPPAALRAREQRDGEHGRTHVTIAWVKEWKQARQACAATTEELFEAVLSSEMTDLTQLQIKGLGTASKEDSRCWYLVVEWPAATAWRAQCRLPPHDFHITVGFLGADIHGVTKDVTTLV